MIHKLFFIGGLILLIAAMVLHCKRNHAFMCSHHKMDHRKKSDFVLKQMGKKLDLTELQKAKLIEIRNHMLAKHDSLCPEHEKMFETILSEIEKETLDQEMLNNMFQRKIEKLKKMHPVVLSELSEFHAILSSEQKQKLVALMRKHHGKRCH